MNPGERRIHTNANATCFPAARQGRKNDRFHVNITCQSLEVEKEPSNQQRADLPPLLIHPLSLSLFPPAIQQRIKKMVTWFLPKVPLFLREDKIHNPPSYNTFSVPLARAGLLIYFHLNIKLCTNLKNRSVVVRRFLSSQAIFESKAVQAPKAMILCEFKRLISRSAANAYQRNRLRCRLWGRWLVPLQIPMSMPH